MKNAYISSLRQNPLEGRLAKFKLPKRTVFVDELPRNTIGKVQKNVLREKFADLYVAPAQTS